MKVTKVDAPLELRKYGDDWYLIERATHDGRQWTEPVEDGWQYMRSARISGTDADVEGTGYEMRVIARAIRARGVASYKRCEVAVKGEEALFCSPRNSTVRAAVPLVHADALADEIERVLGPE